MGIFRTIKKIKKLMGLAVAILVAFVKIRVILFIRRGANSNKLPAGPTDESKINDLL